ncbi:hypothetical protein [Chryseobacterium scophthalmum]|uniref:hypothetical protein n=1 Tax=Chryseobacterium scophthalmum TaxID=59733 RepID=UPI003D028D97
MKTGIITRNPGYGGMENVGDSDMNHMVSALGNLENNFSLKISIFLTDKQKLLIHQPGFT